MFSQNEELKLKSVHDNLFLDCSVDHQLTTLITALNFSVINNGVLLVKKLKMRSFGMELNLWEWSLLEWS
jgi:hypothetical protein